MKRVLFYTVLMTAALLMPVLSQTYPIKVAVYNDDGGSLTGTMRIEESLADTNVYRVTRVMAADIRAGILQNFDIIVQPGGSGSGQATALEPSGRDSIRQFLSRGGGYLGICAGSYLASNDYTWSLNILNAKSVDRLHWDRGTGWVKVGLTEYSKKFFNYPHDTISIEYRQGMLMGRSDNESLPGYIRVGVFNTEVALNGAPSGVMIGTTAIAKTVYGDGRVVAISPHPESEEHLQFIIRSVILWLAKDDDFMTFTAPFENEEWIVGKTKKIGWVSDGGLNTARIDYSTDNGTNWTMLTASTTSPYSWVIPDAPSELCKVRIISTAKTNYGDTISFKIIPEPPSIYSISGGNWSQTSTWVGGVIPDSADNVIIDSSHTVIVDADAKCNDLTFGDASSRLGMSADLRIFGNVNLFDNSSNPFYSGSNLWDDGEKMIFTGIAETQTINNLGTTSTSPYPIRFQELVIDKPTGKFTTGPGANLKLGIGNSIEVINGTFELGSTDDIEGRNTSGSATTPTIIVRSGGVFDMVGSSSHIRRGNFTGEETSKIGTMTVYGEANLAASSTNRINIGNIDVMNGGTLKIPYLSAGNMAASCLNPGIITVKSGGVFSNNLITNYWYNNATVPATVNIEPGGEYYTGSSTTLLAPVTNVEGDIRFARGGDQTIPAALDTVGGKVIPSGSGVKTLGANLTVLEGLSLRGTATFGLGGFTLTYGPDATLSYGASGQATAQIASNEEWPAVNGPVNVQIYNSGGVTLHDNRTINGNLTLTLGTFDNNGASDDKVLTIAAGKSIRRARGELTVSPTFAGVYNVDYISNLSGVTTGFELTAAPHLLGNFTITGSEGVTLDKHVTVNGTLAITGSPLTTGDFTVYLSPNATVIEQPGKRVEGSIQTTRTVLQNANNTFGGIGVEINAAGTAPGATIVKRVTGVSYLINNNPTILRYFDITPLVNNNLNAQLVIHYDESELLGIPELNLAATRSTNQGTNWIFAGGTSDSVNNTVTVQNVYSFSRWTVGDADSIVPVELTSFIASADKERVKLEWTTATETNNAGFEIQRKSSGEWEKAGFVEGKGTTAEEQNYSFTDRVKNAGKYSYRLKQMDFDGSFDYSNIIEVEAGFVPKVFNLNQNYPNPFNPSTTIEFTLAEVGMTELKIFNIIGQEVTSLFKEEGKAGQIYRVNFNASDLPSGIYFVKLVQGSRQMMKKMILIK
ncbi:MAG: BPL-N domain-containing protein [Ignavibacteriaceae bacterium]